MGELEDRISSVLSDPGQMEQIMAMAKSLMGPQDAPQAKTEAAPSKVSSLMENLDPAMLGRLMGSFSGGGQSDRKHALLEAMKPYLSQRRREKLDRAMELARMIHMAELAFGVFGGGDHAQI